MKNKRFLVFLAAGLLASGFAGPEDVSGTPRVATYTGKEIVVTAGRVEESKKDVTSNITVIGREEIEASPSHDLGDLLAEKSIGHIQKYPGSNTTVGIRGFRSDAHGNDLKGKILLLLNGRRAGTGNLAKISTANVERIEIIRGPAAVQYGSAAMGGVVNVITRKGSGTPSMFVWHEEGSFDYHETTAGAFGALGGFDYSGSYSFSDMGDYETGAGERYYNTGYDGRVKASLNAGYTFAEGHRLGIIVNHFGLDRTGSPSYLVANDRTSYTEQENRSVDIGYTGRTGDGSFNWMLRYFFGQDDYGYRSPSWGFASDRNVDQKGAQAQVSWSKDSFGLTAGFDWLDYDVESTMSPMKSRYENPAAFLIVKTGLLDDALILSGGLRYDSYDVSIENDEGSDESTDNLTGSAGIAWNLGENVKLRFNYADGFRMPSAGELAGYYPYFGGGFYEGNPELKPEKSSTVEGGVDIVSGGFVSSLTYFHSDFSDKIQEKALPSGNITWENIGGATIAGFEGELSIENRFSLARTELSVTPFFSFTWLTDYNDDETGDHLLYTPEWNTSGGIRFHETHGFKGAFTVSSFGKNHIQDYVTSWAGDVVAKGGFTVASLMLAKTFTFDEQFGRSFTVRGEVENLFDREYQYVNGYPMPGRSFNLGLRVDI